MLRHSRKRDAILEKIRSTKSHPNADWVYSELKSEIPDLSLATVYRNIAAFIASGELVSAGIVDSKERYDADTSPHAHFVCEVCGSVSDVRTDCAVEFTAECEKQLGCEVTRCELIFRGVCTGCAKNPRQVTHLQSE